MNRHRPAPLRLSLISLIAITATTLTISCGKPAAPDGGNDDFAHAGMQGGGEALVSGRSLELVSWLVQFNRLNSPEKLETMLNKTPGKFVPVDSDNDGNHDYIAVAEDPEPARDDHALLLRARPDADAPEEEGVLLATLFFNEDWALTGYSRSVAKAPAPTPTTIAVAAASAATYSANQKAEPIQTAAIATAIGEPEAEAAPSDPLLDAAPGKAAPPVVAVPAGSDDNAGLHAIP